MTQCGTIRALGLQKIATYMNIVTFYLIMIPLSVLLIFHVGHHKDYVENVPTIGLGIIGAWCATIVALFFQNVICGYIIYIDADWY